MLIKCYFATTVMVDTICYALSQSSLKFLSAFGIIYHVSLQHLDFYFDLDTLFPAQVWGGYMKISSQPPFVHCIYMFVHIFLVD
jgi:hypothetical protein